MKAKDVKYALSLLNRKQAIESVLEAVSDNSSITITVQRGQSPGAQIGMLLTPGEEISELMVKIMELNLIDVNTQLKELGVE